MRPARWLWIPGAALAVLYWPRGTARVSAALDRPHVRPAPAFELRALMSRLARIDLSHLPVALTQPLLVRGMVRDPRGAPAAGVTVVPDLHGDLGVSPGPVVSDESGRFSLPVALPYGGQASGFLTASAGGDLRAAAEVELAGGEPGAEVVLALAASPSLRGIVRVDGVPAAGIQLSARRRHGEGPRVEAVSSAGGAFALPLYQAGVYDLDVDGQGRHLTLPWVQVLGARELDVDLTGLASLRLHVTDLAGAPIDAVRIESVGDPARTLALTDPSGDATVELEPGSHVCLVREGYRSWLVGTGERGPVTLLPAFELRGTVQAPPGGLTRIWAQSVTQPWRRHVVATLAQAGDFSATVDEAGLYEVSADVVGYGESQQRVIRLGGPSADAGTLIVLPDHGTLSGRVVDGKGEPLAEASLRIEGGRDDVYVHSDRQGRFERRLAAGRYQVHTSIDGEYVHGSAVITADGRTELELAPTFDRPPAASADEPDSDDGADYTLGLELEHADDDSDVVLGTSSAAPLPGGLALGDRVLAVNGVAVRDGVPDGARGSRVRLDVLRPETGRRFSAVVSRSVRVPPDVEDCN